LLFRLKMFKKTAPFSVSRSQGGFVFS